MENWLIDIAIMYGMDMGILIALFAVVLARRHR